MYLGHLLSPEVKCNGDGVAGIVDLHLVLRVILVLPDQRRLQTRHLILLPVDEYLTTLIGEDI